MLHCREAGSGPPLVLLHAFPLQGVMFAPQLDGLAQSFHVLAPDLPGFGDSAPTLGAALTMEQAADDVLALLDHLRLERVVVGGVSMGGYIAMAMVRRDPTRVAGLALMNTHARADDDTAKAARETTAERVLAQGTQVLVETMATKLISPQAPEALKVHVARIIREGDPAGAAAALRGMALRPDSREILSRYAGPALVVSGGLDAMIPQDRVQELATLIQGAEHLRLPSAGHLASLESPDPVNAALERFLRKVFAH